MASWINPAPFRQRMLAYGDMGSGKTKGLLDWATVMPGKVRIVDTDDAVGIIMHRCYPELVKEGKVEVRVVTEWPEVGDALTWAFDGMGKDDLVGIDSMTDLRYFNMDWATEQVTGKDMDGFMTQWLTVSSVADIKKKGTQGFLISNGVYDLANPTWRGTIKKAVKVPKCHVYMTAHSSAQGHPNEDSLTKQLYSSVGYKPDTEKNVGFDAASVVLLGKSKVGKLSYSVIKDWGSAGGERDVEYENLAMAWLWKINGWRPGKAGA